ncbi:Rv3654c family TadE-like protein [Prescottella subtropica]|uniref:Rv3654c family TadE-like protein n=1 Tax=Prescottella subtropica TaxID=2545757 RepID=UPI001F4FF436|nr:Rv3654c family TadE-like protein [Prescottella subtropica]
MRDDEGGATVFACFALAGLVAVTAILLHLGGAVAARHRAQSAADLGALAAAQALADGEPACPVAMSVVSRMRAQVSGCVVDGWDVQVSTEVTPGGVPFGSGPARAVARAGPAE